MTICIAAIAQEDGKEYIVIAADNMCLNYLNGKLMGDFNIKKFKYFDKNKCVAMLSGDILNFDKFISNIGYDMTYLDCLNKIHKNYMRLKDEMKYNFLKSEYFPEKNITEVLKNLQSRLDFKEIIEKIARFDDRTKIILAGIDESGKAHINEINNKSIKNMNFRKFHCIGEGETHSTVCLLQNKQSKNYSVKETIYNVYKAKRFSEVMQGIGKETDMAVFSKDSYKELSKKDFDVLEKVFKEELEYGKCHKDLDKITF